MMLAVKKALPVDLSLKAAAVTDFKPVKRKDEKIKKDELNLKSIIFKKNNDILEFLSKIIKIDHV